MSPQGISGMDSGLNNWMIESSWITMTRAERLRPPVLATTESVQQWMAGFEPISLPSAEWFFQCTVSTAEDCAMGKPRCV